MKPFLFFLSGAALAAVITVVIYKNLKSDLKIKKDEKAIPKKDNKPGIDLNKYARPSSIE